MYKTLIRTRIKEKFKTIENFSRYVNIPRTTINFILKHGVGSSNYDMVNKIFNALDIYPIEQKPIVLDNRSIKLLDLFESLDDMGKHTVESVAETENRRITNLSSSDALIAAYGSLSASHPITDDEKIVLNLLQNIKEDNLSNE